MPRRVGASGGGGRQGARGGAEWGGEEGAGLRTCFVGALLRSMVAAAAGHARASAPARDDARSPLRLATRGGGGQAAASQCTSSVWRPEAEHGCWRLARRRCAPRPGATVPGTAVEHSRACILVSRLRGDRATWQWEESNWLKCKPPCFAAQRRHLQ